MATEYNKAVISIIELIVANNPAGTAQALKKAGYDIGNYVPAGELKTALLQLERTNPEKFWNMLRDIEWNPGINNWTNDPKYQQPIMEALSKQTGSPVAKGGFWGTLLDLGVQLFLGQPTPPQPPPPQQQIPWGIFLITVFIITAVIVIVFFAIKFLRK